MTEEYANFEKYLTMPYSWQISQPIERYISVHAHSTTYFVPEWFEYPGISIYHVHRRAYEHGQ